MTWFVIVRTLLVSLLALEFIVYVETTCDEATPGADGECGRSRSLVSNTRIEPWF